MNMGSLRAELVFPASYKSTPDLETRRGGEGLGGGGPSDDEGELDEDLMMMIMGTTPQQGGRPWRDSSAAPAGSGFDDGSRFTNGQPALRAQQVQNLLRFKVDISVEDEGIDKLLSRVE